LTLTSPVGGCALPGLALYWATAPTGVPEPTRIPTRTTTEGRAHNRAADLTCRNPLVSLGRGKSHFADHQRLRIQPMESPGWAQAAEDEGWAPPCFVWPPGPLPRQLSLCSDSSPNQTRTRQRRARASRYAAGGPLTPSAAAPSVQCDAAPQHPDEPSRSAPFTTKALPTRRGLANHEGCRRTPGRPPPAGRLSTTGVRGDGALRSLLVALVYTFAPPAHPDSRSSVMARNTLAIVRAWVVLE